MSKIFFGRHIDLLLIAEKGPRLYLLIKDFTTFMYDHTLHCGRKHFCCYCLQAFSTTEILKCHMNDCFKINGKHMIKMPKKDKYKRKIESPFMIYAESILVPDNN